MTDFDKAMEKLMQAIRESGQQDVILRTLKKANRKLEAKAHFRNLKKEY